MKLVDEEEVVGEGAKVKVEMTGVSDVFASDAVASRDGFSLTDRGGRDGRAGLAAEEAGRGGAWWTIAGTEGTRGMAG